MHIVVTGACGFIGSVLCARALEQGHSVTALDNRSRGLNKVWELPGIRFEEFDCQTGIKAYLSADRAHYADQAVVHLAAGTGSLDRPLEELRKLNVSMTQNVALDTASTPSVKAFVFPTTSLALGVPESPYVISKEEAMTWLQTDDNPLRKAGCHILPFRFFNVTGGYRGFSELRKNEVHIIPTMVQAFNQEQPFVINGMDYDTYDGTPSRDFVHVVDVADYILYNIIRAVDWAKPDLNADGCIWVGTGKATTVKRMVEHFKRDLFRRGYSTRHVDDFHVTFSRERRPFDVGALHCEQSQTLAQWRPLRTIEQALRDELDVLLSEIPTATRI